MSVLGRDQVLRVRRLIEIRSLANFPAKLPICFDCRVWLHTYRDVGGYFDVGFPPAPLGQWLIV